MLNTVTGARIQFILYLVNISAYYSFFLNIALDPDAVSGICMGIVAYYTRDARSESFRVAARQTLIHSARIPSAGREISDPHRP